MKRELFSSRLAAVLTMIGVSVGLGNVWRFPYMMGSHGGSAFLFVYLGFVAVFGIPAIIGEWALGRETRRGPYGAFSRSFGSMGRVVGVVLLLNVLVANSYYLVIVAQLVYTTFFSFAQGFEEATRGAYVASLERPEVKYPIALGLIGVELVVLGLGVVRGIERASKIIVPFFGVVVLYMIIHSLTLDGVFAHLREFIRPDFASLTAENLFAAMGQAFFSLSLGGTFFLIYGSYLKDGEDLTLGAAWTALGDVGASLLASLFVVPTILVFALDLRSGPGLIFETLPVLFGAMPGGRIVGSVFLLALSLVAFLSSLAALQVVFGACLDSFSLSVRKALVAVGIATAVLVLPSVLRPSLIGTLDLVCGSGMQCLGSGLALIALTWGLGRNATRRQLFGEGGEKGEGVWGRILFLWLRWVVPIALLLTLAAYLKSAVF